MDNITKDPFLETIIGKTVYNVKEVYMPSSYYAMGLPMALRTGTMYCAKVSSGNTTLVNSLISNGFSLVSFEITFSGFGQKFPLSTNKGINVLDFHEGRFPDSGEFFDSIVNIGYTAFKHTRFHADPNISNSVANTIKGQWIYNALMGRRGEKTGVACIENKPVGFIIVLRDGDKIIVDLIGVSKEYHGKGVGSALMNWMIRTYDYTSGSNIHMFMAGTQIQNIDAIYLYKKFKINNIYKSNYVLHMHTR